MQQLEFIFRTTFYCSTGIQTHVSQWSCTRLEPLKDTLPTEQPCRGNSLSILGAVHYSKQLHNFSTEHCAHKVTRIFAILWIEPGSAGLEKWRLPLRYTALKLKLNLVLKPDTSILRCYCILFKISAIKWPIRVKVSFVRTNILQARYQIIKSGLFFHYFNVNLY